MSKAAAKLAGVSISVAEHLEAAEDFLGSAEERQNDPDWALVEAELAKAHLIAAALKTGLSLLGGDRKGAFKAAPMVIGMVSKLAR